MIRLYKVRKEYGLARVALADVTFNVHRGEFVVLAGPSGAGKTTLLKILIGQETATSGKAVVHGRNIARMSGAHLAALRREMGLVFQDPRLIDRIPVVENISLAAEVCGIGRAQARRRAATLLELIGLSRAATALPADLSGGERQRVSLARALANDPVLLLADEPTGSLDRRNAREILRLLGLVNETGTTVLMATHDQSVAASLGRRTLQIDSGRLVEAESPELSAWL